MVQVKMRYGIDLGTTNSAICKIENGEPVIRKTDTLKDTLPSCVSYTKKELSESEIVHITIYAKISLKPQKMV